MTYKLAMISGALLTGAALTLAAPAFAAGAMPGNPQGMPADPAMQTQSMHTQSMQAMRSTPGQSLSSVSDAKQKLASANVQDSAGKPVGQVEDVKTASSGTPTSVQVALNTPTGQGKIVSIRASHLTYDQGTNTVMAKLSQSEIEALPPSTPVSPTQASSSMMAPTRSAATSPSGY